MHKSRSNRAEAAGSGPTFGIFATPFKFFDLK